MPFPGTLTQSGSGSGQTAVDCRITSGFGAITVREFQVVSNGGLALSATVTMDNPVSGDNTVLVQCRVFRENAVDSTLNYTLIVRRAAEPILHNGFERAGDPHWTKGVNHATQEHRWQGALAAAWPALASLACAAYALAPARFPADTGQTMALLAVAELPALFLGVAHAEAMKEDSRSGRYLSYIIGFGVVLLVLGLHLGLAVEMRFLMPMFGWVVVGHLVNLYTAGPDPKLAHDRAWAELFDKATLFALTPSVVAAIALTGLSLHLAGLAFGFDFDRWASAQVHKLEATDFAWIPAVYLALVAGSAAHSHGQGFALHRRRWLDRPLLNFLTRKSSGDPE